MGDGLMEGNATRFTMSALFAKNETFSDEQIQKVSHPNYMEAQSFREGGRNAFQYEKMCYAVYSYFYA
jgi:hypothetical protein